LHNHLLSLDDETTDILKEIPVKKKSEFVRNAIKHYSRTVTFDASGEKTTATVEVTQEHPVLQEEYPIAKGSWRR
jgi:hypothetical protein